MYTCGRGAACVDWLSTVLLWLVIGGAILAVVLLVKAWNWLRARGGNPVAREHRLARGLADRTGMSHEAALAAREALRSANAGAQPEWDAASVERSIHEFSTEAIEELGSAGWTERVVFHWAQRRWQTTQQRNEAIETLIKRSVLVGGESGVPARGLRAMVWSLYDSLR